MDTLTLIENYRDDAARREQFYTFVKAVFPRADFRTWHDRGFWCEEYVPHSLIDGDRIVANVSTTTMSLLVDGRPVRGLQFGTVGTIPEYTGRGLSRRLMEHVIAGYERDVDLMFLFANDDVVQFYPKFGFREYRDNIFVSHRSVMPGTGRTRRLDMADPIDLASLRERLVRRTAISRLFGAENYPGITLWHALNLFPDKVFHIPGEDIIAFASLRDGRLGIYDLVFDRPFDLEAVLPTLVGGEGAREIRWHFSPDVVPFEFDSVEAPEDSHLFVRGAFPIGDISFKFPFTAET